MSEMHSSPPQWLETVAWVFIAMAIVSAIAIAMDVIRGHRQKMAVMNLVYPISALYWGPVALWFYFRHGRDTSESKAAWPPYARAVSHCGAGCTVGDLVGEWGVFVFGITLFGASLYADMAITLALAWIAGVAFQYFTISPMRDLSPGKGLVQAVEADTLSIVAFQIGMFVWMALYQKGFFAHPLSKSTASYWFLMQIAMIVGYFTALPMNVWLVKKGVKERM